MRLIDADALADALFGTRKNYPQWVADTISNMPDAVVRCGDCKKRYTVLCIQEEAGNINNQDEWYCADGESR